MNELQFIISWFVAGLISIIIVWILELRGKEFDENYFSREHVIVSLVMIIFGYMSFVIIYAALTQDKKYFTRFIHKIANIGIKKETNEEVTEVENN